jgi:transcriptional regulator with XRE-family HTH domain
MAERRVAELKDRLREALEKRNMRPVDLMEKTGVPKSALSFYLAGKSKPKADRLYIIAQALDISETWLLGYAVPMDRTFDQKKNDQLAKLVAKLRSDEGFYNTVVALSGLDENQYKGIEQLVLALKK